MRSRMTPARIVAMAVALAAATVAVAAGSAAPPAQAGITVGAQLVAGGLQVPIGFTFTQKGLIYYLERSTGQVRVLNPTTDHDRLFFSVTKVNSEGERGALGIALHPDYPKKPFVYVFATRRMHGKLRNQVLRIKAEDGKGTGFRVLLSSRVDADTNHNGGRIAFGPDGKLFVVIGDGGGTFPTDPRHAQNLAERRGKIHRINPDGSVPEGNPISGSTVWVYGIRNSIGFGWDPGTDRLWESENGPECNDEINLIRKGGNYGWGPKEACGSPAEPADTNNSGPTPRHFPKYTLADTIGMTGIAVCESCGLPALDDHLVYSGVNFDSVRAIALNGARDGVSGSDQEIYQPPSSAISFETGPDGSIYFSTFSAIYRLVPST
jgi:glucose/arabinose dehydrogenase